MSDALLTRRVLSVLAGAGSYERATMTKLQAEFTGMFVTGPKHVWGACRYKASALCWSPPLPLADP